MEAKFSGPSYTLGAEEELMIPDRETCDLATEIEALIAAYEGDGEVKPELLQSVCEIATEPHEDVGGVARELRRRRREVAAAADENGLCIGSAGTHPFALW